MSIKKSCIDRRDFLKSAVAAGAAAAVPAFPNTRRPNIIFFFSDDQGYHDLGCYGNKEIKTPNIDRIAAEGMRLSSFYVTCSVCTPSRSGLLTGRYPHRNGLFENIRNDMVNYKHVYKELEYATSPEMTQGLDLREATIAQELKEQGYTTGIFGKWDSGRARRFLPLQRGFDEYYGFANTGIDYWTHERYGMPSLFRGNQRIKEKGYFTDLIRREALSFVERNKGKPFFLYVPFNAPHGASNLNYKGAQAPDRYVKMYGNLPGDRRQRYMAAVTCMDDAIGEILQKVESLGLEKDTLVVFASDNGGGDTSPLRGGKGTMYEGGFRVPCVIKWPGRIKPGQVSDAFVSSLDFFPTFISAAGGRLRKDIVYDGFDLLPVLTEGRPAQRKEHYWELRGQRAARVGKWKWVLPQQGERLDIPKDTTGELYDLENDISESRNLAMEKPEVLKMMQEKWDDWFTEMYNSEDRGPFSKAYFELLGYGRGESRIKEIK